MRARRFALLALLLAPAAYVQTVNPSAVLNSQHNLAAGGRGPVTSTETRACVFCHISHNGTTITGYLWNQRSSQAAYTPYTSPTLKAAPGSAAAGSSRLCLSCHDGTVALGQTVGSGTIPISGSFAADDITGTDFRRHHPTGIRPVDNGEIYAGLAQTPARSNDPAVKLPNNIVECITCHEPHEEMRDAARGKFLARSNQNGALCLACHDVSRAAPNNLNGWTGSAHQAAANTVAEFYGSVGANACLSCHLPHAPAAAVPLLRASEETTCMICHSGAGTTPALPSVATEFAQIYAHPTTTLSGMHQGGENAFPLNGNRHAECPDCHNSHASRPRIATPLAPAVMPPLAGATGVDAGSGAVALRPAANEYEVCFKCHANSTSKPQSVSGYSRYGRQPWRVTDTATADASNTRLEFSSLVSRHNVTLPRQHSSTDVPSLRANMLTLAGAPGRSLAAGTYIYCSDCHNNDKAASSGGAQASGPHGSIYPHILERRYETEPPPASPGGSGSGVSYQAGLTGTYALCDKCHDVAGSILQDRSFRRHSLHISSVRASCSTCHDSHGINGGSATANPSLVNFDTAVVGPSSQGTLYLQRTGTFTGRCYLRCHGKDHNGLSY